MRFCNWKETLALKAPLGERVTILLAGLGQGAHCLPQAHTMEGEEEVWWCRVDPLPHRHSRESSALVGFL